MFFLMAKKWGCLGLIAIYKCYLLLLISWRMMKGKNLGLLNERMIRGVYACYFDCFLFKFIHFFIFPFPPLFIDFLSFPPRWQVAVGISPNGQFQHVSFVNGISTPRGGTHVTYIADQIATNIAARVNRRNKGLAISANSVKSHLYGRFFFFLFLFPLLSPSPPSPRFIVVNCLVNNPSFDSQTKETLTSGVSSFGKDCSISERIYQKLMGGGVLENRVVAFANMRQKMELDGRTPKRR